MSDIKRSGVEPFETLEESISRWKMILNPDVVVIFGGEPCLHPKLPQICSLLRQSWPESTMRLITNGYLLDNFDASIWFDFEPLELQISIHRKDHESIINAQIKNILKQRHPWTVTRNGGPGEHRQITWAHGKISIYKSIFETFVVPYKQMSNKLGPWMSDPVLAHKICGAPSTPILYKGLLYKCPPVANLIDITGENWFDYRAVDTDGDIKTFIDSIGKPEKVCGQCPELSQASQIDHFNKENVVVRLKNFS